MESWHFWNNPIKWNEIFTKFIFSSITGKFLQQKRIIFEPFLSLWDIQLLQRTLRQSTQLLIFQQLRLRLSLGLYCYTTIYVCTWAGSRKVTHTQLWKGLDHRTTTKHGPMLVMVPNVHCASKVSKVSQKCFVATLQLCLQQLSWVPS